MFSDAEKGEIFSQLMKAITEATAKEGDGNPQTNARLKAILETAEEMRIPRGNIKSAIEKGIQLYQRRRQ